MFAENRFPVHHPSGGEKLTKEADRQEADIENIVKRYEATGQLPLDPNRERRARFGDFSEPWELFGAMTRVREAEWAFRSLPAEVRRACHDDPVEFLGKCSSEEGVAELVKLGLVVDELPAGARAAVQSEPGSGSSGSEGSASDSKVTPVASSGGDQAS